MLHYCKIGVSAVHIWKCQNNMVDVVHSNKLKFWYFHDNQFSRAHPYVWYNSMVYADSWENIRIDCITDASSWQNYKIS